MKKPIVIGVSPNVEKKDAILALKLFFSPSEYFKAQHIRALERWFIRYFDTSHAISFSSGRSALYAILKCLDVQKGDEVLLQSFTCSVVPNSIIAADAKPVYVDTTDTLVMDPDDLEKKITKKSKVILVQHTFGVPTDMDMIMTIAKKYKLLVVEDCAHTIGGTYGNKKLGTIGDAAFFSFGRDKAFSSVFGGMAITKSERLGKKLRIYQTNLPKPSILWTMQQLVHPFFFWTILPLYNTVFGKLLIVLFQNLQLLSLPVAPHEKRGKFYQEQVKSMPNQLAALALLQLKRIKQFNEIRESFIEEYINQLKSLSFLKIPTITSNPLLRFPVFMERETPAGGDLAERDRLIKYFRQKGIYLGNWYSNVIDPKGTVFESVNYKTGSCPNAEKLAQEVINLPCYPTMKQEDARTVIDTLRNYEKSK